MYTMLLMLFAVHAWLYWRIAHQHKGIPRNTGALFFLERAGSTVYARILAAGFLAAWHIPSAVCASVRALAANANRAGASRRCCFLPYVPTLFSAIALAAENVKVTSAAASIPELIYNFAFLLTNGQNLLIPLFAGIVIYSLWRTRSSVAWKIAPCVADGSALDHSASTKQ